jgi:hypothetical protein
MPHTMCDLKQALYHKFLNKCWQAFLIYIDFPPTIFISLMTASYEAETYRVQLDSSSPDRSSFGLIRTKAM